MSLCLNKKEEIPILLDLKKKKKSYCILGFGPFPLEFIKILEGKEFLIPPLIRDPDALPPQQQWIVWIMTVVSEQQTVLD